MPKTGAAPVPESGTTVGLPGAFDAMLKLADCRPIAVGAKVTLMVQEAPAATLEHAFVCAKLAAFVPVIVMPLTVSVAVPVLVTVTGWAPLVVPVACTANVRPAGLTLMVGAVPVPDSATTVGLPGAFDAMLMLADCRPAAVGVKVTLMAHDAPTAKLVQLLVCPNAVAFVPVSVTLLTVSAAVPVLITVTGWAALVVPTA